MPKTVDKDLVYKYVLEPKKIEESTRKKLESDMDFMIEVIIIKKDKNLLKKCLKDFIKSSYHVSKLIEIFKGDKDVINEIATSFIFVNKETGISKNQVYIDLFELLPQNELLKSLVQDIYIKETKTYREKTTNKNLGFRKICSKYKDNENTNSFYANMMIKELFYTNDKLDFEKVLFDMSTKNLDVNDYEVKVFILKYVEKHDSDLATYLKSNTKMLNNLVDKINEVRMTALHNEDRITKDIINGKLKEINEYNDLFDIDDNRIMVMFALFLESINMITCFEETDIIDTEDKSTLDVLKNLTCDDKEFVLNLCESLLTEINCIHVPAVEINKEETSGKLALIFKRK